MADGSSLRESVGLNSPRRYSVNQERTIAARRSPALRSLYSHEASDCLRLPWLQRSLRHKDQLRVRCRPASPLKLENVPTLPINELSRAIDSRTDGSMSAMDPPPKFDANLNIQRT